MRTEIIHFNDKNTNRLMYERADEKAPSNKSSREKMKALLSKAILGELTPAQRLCITEYYLNGKKEKQIANELGVNISTVSRHICAARRKLRNIAKYF